MYPTKKLGNLGKVIRGVTYSKGDLLDSSVEGCLTLLRANNINDGINFDELQYLPKGFVEGDKILKKGDIIFCMSSGSRSLVGKNTIVPELENHSFGAFCSSFRINSDDNINYIGYFLKSETYKKYIYSLSQGVNILNLRGSDLENLEIPLPPLSAQSRIVARLDVAFASIDEQTSLLRANIVDVEKMKKSVLRGIFNDTTILKKYIHELFKIKSGDFLPKSNMKEDGQYDVYGGNGINGKHNEFNLDGENIIIGRVGALCGNVRLVEGKFWLTDNAFYVSEYLIGNVDKKYLKIILEFLNLGETANKAAQPVISYKSISNIQIPLPTLPRQHEIVAHLDEVFETTRILRAEYEAQIRDLEILKQSLLEEAFAGRLVPEEN